MSLRKAEFQTARGTLPYLFIPSEPGRKAPLVVFLHGAKDRGNDLSKLLAWGFPKFASESAGLPYHWLALQIPEGGTWQEWRAELFELIDLLHQEHGAYRFILTGFSLGSAGAWQIAADNPDRVSGLVIVSGRLPQTIQPSSLSGLENVPVWIFHGEADDKAPVSAAVAAHQTLVSVGIPSRLSVVPGGDHFIADTVYPSEALQSWLAREDKSVFPYGLSPHLEADAEAVAAK